MIEALKTYDFESHGLIAPDHARHALKQIKMVITKEVDEAIKASLRESWGGDDLQVDYISLVRRIARDPPGHVREESTRVKGVPLLVREPQTKEEGLRALEALEN